MSVHAEVDLIKKLGDRAEGAKICVYRFNIGDHSTHRAARTSLPCPTCQYSLRKARVARVNAIDLDGELKTIKHDELLKFETNPYFLAKHLYMYNPTLRSQLLAHASS